MCEILFWIAKRYISPLRCKSRSTRNISLARCFLHNVAHFCCILLRCISRLDFWLGQGYGSFLYCTALRLTLLCSLPSQRVTDHQPAAAAERQPQTPNPQSLPPPAHEKYVFRCQMFGYKREAVSEKLLHCSNGWRTERSRPSPKSVQGPRPNSHRKAAKAETGSEASFHSNKSTECLRRVRGFQKVRSLPYIPTHGVVISLHIVIECSCSLSKSNHQSRRKQLIMTVSRPINGLEWSSSIKCTHPERKPGSNWHLLVVPGSIVLNSTSG